MQDEKTQPRGSTTNLNLRADPETIKLLYALADRWGVTRSAAIRFALRVAAQAEGLALEPLTPDDLERAPGPRPRRKMDDQ
jgi:antitoxin component of RelBE/YafQ-DinJ toxin-antitoxin module